MFTEKSIESFFHQKGKAVEFSYSEKYQKERDIFRRVKHVGESEQVYEKSKSGAPTKQPEQGAKHESYKARIGIAVVDLNHDGTGDILALLDSHLLCKGQCVYILLSDANGGWKLQDEVFPSGLEILTSRHRGCSDLRTRTGGMGPTIEGEGWAQARTRISRFDGKTYRTSLERVRESDAKTGKSAVSTWIYGPPCPFSLLDIR